MSLKLSARTRPRPKSFGDIGKIGDEMEQANARRDFEKVEELSLKGGRIGQTTGSRICRIDGWDWGRWTGVRGRSGNQVNDTATRQVVCPVEADYFRVERPLLALADIPLYTAHVRFRG